MRVVSSRQHLGKPEHLPIKLHMENETMDVLKWQCGQFLSGFRRVQLAQPDNGRQKWKNVRNQCGCKDNILLNTTHVSRCYRFAGFRNEFYFRTGVQFRNFDHSMKQHHLINQLQGKYLQKLLQKTKELLFTHIKTQCM